MMRFQQLVRQLAFGGDGISIFFIKGLDLKLLGRVHPTILSGHLFLD